MKKILFALLALASLAVLVFPVFSSCPCDVNDDGVIDMRDVGIVGKAFGSYPGHSRWNPLADIDNSTRVDMVDVGIVARHFGETC